MNLLQAYHILTDYPLASAGHLRNMRVAVYKKLLGRHPAATVRRYLPMIAKILAKEKDSAR